MLLRMRLSNTMIKVLLVIAIAIICGIALYGITLWSMKSESKLRKEQEYDWWIRHSKGYIASNE